MIDGLADSGLDDDTIDRIAGRNWIRLYNYVVSDHSKPIDVELADAAHLGPAAR